MHRRFGGKTRGKEPIERIRHRWEDNNEIDLRDIGWTDMDWNHLAQDTDQLRSF
jgi:hypothetical protein